MKDERLRDDIDPVYKWKEDLIFKDNKENEMTFEEIAKFKEDLITYKGRIMNNGKTLLEFFKKRDKAEILIENLFIHNVYLHYQMDTTNGEYQKMMQKTREVAYDFYDALSFVENEILKDDYKKLLIEEPLLMEYEFYLYNIDREKSHILSEKEEAILAKVSKVMGNGEDTFENIMYADANFGCIKDEFGQTVVVNNSNYSRLLRSNDRNTRKKAYKKRNKYYKDFQNTIVNAFLHTVKESFFESNVRRFKNPLEQNLFNDDVPKDMYYGLVNIISSNTNYLKKYFDLKRKLLKLDILYPYDFAVMPELGIKNEIEYNDAITQIKKALKVLGDDYTSSLNKYLDNNLIDVFPNKGKIAGYQVSSYSKGPLISYDYNNSYSNFFGLIHEIGHAMHSHYTNIKQPYIYSNYGLFVAETASLTNEILLTNYLVNNAKTKDEKIFLLMKEIEEINHYLFDVILCVEHEKEVFNREEAGNPMSVSEVCDFNYELDKKYYGSKKVKILDEAKYSWMVHSQYHRPYYFYKYAIGMVAALIIGKKIINKEEGFVTKYIEFLSSGGSKKIFDLYNELGIDLTDPNTYLNAVDYFNSRVELLEQLVNE